MKVTPGPIQQYFPMNTEHKFGTSTKGKLVNLREYLKPYADGSIVFGIGASPEGDPAKDTEY